MLGVNTVKHFDKHFVRLPQKIQDKFYERLKLFVLNRTHPLLQNHRLSGEWIGHSSIRVTGDYRAIYEWLDSETVSFVAIGTHHELYGT
jgi:addiction module RelE/StbE family toxin